MDVSRPTRCFTCGQAVGVPPALNRLSDGQSCPTCAERLLEYVPAALPTRQRGPAGRPAGAARGAVHEPADDAHEAEPDGHLGGGPTGSEAPRPAR